MLSLMFPTNVICEMASLLSVSSLLGSSTTVRLKRRAVQDHIRFHQVRNGKETGDGEFPPCNKVTGGPMDKISAILIVRGSVQLPTSGYFNLQ